MCRLLRFQSGELRFSQTPDRSYSERKQKTIDSANNTQKTDPILKQTTPLVSSAICGTKDSFATHSGRVFLFSERRVQRLDP